ncbi:MAG: SDR family NAD(P)-dependent oxidoreductase [Candidatus Acidiferrales bacterium]
MLEKTEKTCNRRPSPVILCSAETVSVLCEAWPLVNSQAGRRRKNMVETFGATSTTEEVLSGIDLRGKQILVTGVSAGLGVETARSLAAHGANVIGTARDLAKAEAATSRIRRDAAANGGSFELVELDLASLASVRDCADQLVKRGEPFDVVIANAGVMATPFSCTTDHVEMQFGTNHLGHFVLVNRIAPLIRKGGRLVNLSSAGHRFADVDLDDPNFERTPYDPFIAYGRSKTANSLFAVAFDQRHRQRGVRAAAVHPGVIQTDLGRYVEPGRIENMIEQMNDQLIAEGTGPFEWKTIPQGAATSVWAGVVAEAAEIGGRYCENCHVGDIVPEGVTISGVSEGVREYALDPQRAEALWKKSEEMVGESFSR